MKFDKVFSDSFDTFKVFDNIDTTQASLTNINTPKSIWQILNHLIVWQEFQINKLNGIDAKDIDEIDSWKVEKMVSDQNLLMNNITRFHNQIEQIKVGVSELSTESEDIVRKLKIIQDLTVHLSFHLGEIVIIMRQNGHYPMPSEMKLFLEKK